MSAWAPLLAVVAALSAPAAAVASPGDADPSFGTFGSVTLPSIIAPTGVTELPDGGVAVSGGDPSDVPTLAVLDADGSMRDAFGADGVAQFPDLGDVGRLAVAANGDLLLTGTSASGTDVAAVTGDGELDEAFGVAGIAQLDTPGLGGHIDLDAQGRIVLFGPGGAGRLLPGGTPDPAWNGDGLASLPAGFHPFDGALGAGGSAYVTGHTDSHLRGAVRLTGQGAPDTLYGDAGFAPIGGPAAGGGTYAAPTADGGLFLGWSECPAAGGTCPAGAGRLSAAGAPTGGFPEGGLGVIAAARPVVAGNSAVIAGGHIRPPGATGYLGPLPTGGLERVTGAGRADGSYGLRGRAYVYPANHMATIADSAPASGGGVLVVSQVLAGDNLHEGFVTRISGGAGPADEDADGTPDARDPCPTQASAEHRGCPFLAVRRLTFRPSADLGFAGRLLSPAVGCVSGATVEVLRRHHGKRRVVAQATVADSGRWSVAGSKALLRAGSYWARALAGTAFGAGYCPAVRSS